MNGGTIILIPFSKALSAINCPIFSAVLRLLVFSEIDLSCDDAEVITLLPSGSIT